MRKENADVTLPQLGDYGKKASFAAVNWETKHSVINNCAYLIIAACYTQAELWL
jgi:hypothetical protein